MGGQDSASTPYAPTSRNRRKHTTTRLLQSYNIFMHSPNLTNRCFLPFTQLAGADLQDASAIMSDCAAASKGGVSTSLHGCTHSYKEVASIHGIIKQDIVIKGLSTPYVLVRSMHPLQGLAGRARVTPVSSHAVSCSGMALISPTSMRLNQSFLVQLCSRKSIISTVIDRDLNQAVTITSSRTLRHLHWTAQELPHQLHQAHQRSHRL